MTKAASNLQIDSARLWGTIFETAQFGLTPKGGVRRLTLGPEDKQVRNWFSKACEDAGLEVHVDVLGSMFGIRKGRDMSKVPVGLGSTTPESRRNCRSASATGPTRKVRALHRL
jgi:N-carbamoyl-L-amino-acid hydrolase